MSAEPTNHPKQAFVPGNDRPEVRSTRGDPVTDQRVRDISVILDEGFSEKDELEEPQSAGRQRSVFNKNNDKWHPDRCPESVGAKDIERLFELVESNDA
jgi:hypothetical protein